MVFIFLLLALAVNFTSAQLDPSCTKTKIIDCFHTWVDLNNDTSINATELDTFFNSSECGQFGISPLDGAMIIMACDMDHDGVLTMADYDDVTGCMMSIGVQHLCCTTCDNCARFASYNITKRRSLEI